MVRPLNNSNGSCTFCLFVFQYRCQLNAEQYHTASREQLRTAKVEQYSNNRINWNQIKTACAA